MRCDESLQYWGAAYVTARLHEHGITVRGFIKDRRGWLKALGLAAAPVGLARGYRPLLPRQRRVAQELWQRWKWETR